MAECKSFWVQVVVVHNPDTQDMNARATLRCEAGHQWEDRVTSDHHRKLRAKGRRR